jgi:nucleotide-binding universal stress UspA family protein
MDDGFKLSIFHPTDFSWTSKVAFAHALKLAVICGNKFTILHTGSREEPSKDWHLFPRVRDTLENWGLLKPESSEYAVYDKLGIEVEKVDVHKTRPTAAISNHISNYSTDLVVLGVSRNNGMSYSNDYHVSGPIINNINIDTLFIPEGVNGFVSLNNGAARLYRILVPIILSSDPMSTILDAAALGHAMGGDKANVTLLHVGTEKSTPQIEDPDIPCSWNQITREGPVVSTILSTADDISADLIVVAAQTNGDGHNPRTNNPIQEILEYAPCPVLATGS